MNEHYNVCEMLLSFFFQGIFSKCAMGKAIKQNTFNIPPPRKIPGTEIIAPFVIVGDQAFPLLMNMMRPYPEKQVLRSREKEEYNYRHSRARRVSENAFGISTNLFPVYSKPFDIRCQNTRNNLIITTCLLHNMIRDENDDFFLRHRTDIMIEQGEEDTNPPQEQIENDSDRLEEDDELSMQIDSALEAREKFSNYFQREGAVSWRA